MPLQVIGGEYGGRRLKSPPPPTRPTLAIVRRSLLDILAPRVPGALVLDLYAGSGSMGIEALSRGAAGCEFVEASRACVAVIRDNLRLLAGESPPWVGRVHCAPVMTWLQRDAGRLASFDIVFLDPPYGVEELPRVLGQLGGAPLRPGTLLAVEESSSRELSTPSGLRLTRRVRHGDTALTLFEAGA